MFNRNKSWVYGLFGICVLAIFSMGIVSAETFTEKLEQIGLDVTTFSNKKSISRYEIARLLNAANCEDCVQAPLWMQQTYNQIFWNGFKTIDGKDFNDINYGAAVWNKKSYYYCVAYVGENGYMAGYPSTSTKCQGNFCGQNDITVAEVYQTVLNIIQPQIMQKYQINWSNVKSWMNGLSRARRNTILNQTNIETINKADSKLNYAQTNDEFQAWLKYCMYNLSGCNFQKFGKIGQAYWPISELNILYKEGIITAQDAENVYTNPSINGEDALRIFGSVFDNFASCSFDVDYDCDGIPNGKDNCPHTYNINQHDLDGDGIGNVCDDDIDGDGEENIVGIVDDNNRVIVSLWSDELDQTPLGNGNLGFSLFINVNQIASAFPTAVKFSTLTNGDIESIQRDFGDGVKQKVNNSDKVSHTYFQPGTFIVRATAKSKQGGESFAMTKIFIANPKNQNYMLNISPSFSFKNGKVNYTFTPTYSGNLDKIIWSVNNSADESLKVNEKFKTTIQENGTYAITAKGYANGELKATATLYTIQNGSPSFAYMSIKPANLREESIISTKLIGINQKNIENIETNRGGYIDNGIGLTQKYTYPQAGLHFLQQTITLKDGTKLSSSATITIQNPLLTQSYAINIGGKQLSYNPNEKLSFSINTYPVAPVLSLLTNYQAGDKIITLNPNLSKTILNFAYSSAGDKILTNSIEVNKCVALVNQGTVHINSQDTCLSALQEGTLGGYKCDMDNDGIPDICDDDIDGDGIKNLIGIIVRENRDCSITERNVNTDILKKQFGVCSLDNCPFHDNNEQSDLNNNGIGEACEEMILKIFDKTTTSSSEREISITINNDRDLDGIPDDIDQCIDIPGNSINGCPTLHSQECRSSSTCGNGVIDEGETCKSCPIDVGPCSIQCGDGIVQKGENCENCPEDAGECSPCGNGIIDEGEDCKNCPGDVGPCSARCGDGIIQEAENCKNCPEDAGECPYCGNGKIDAGENCKNCPEDVGECSARCGDGVIQEAENCKNCEEDVGVCSARCGDGIIQESETCENCEKDVLMCRKDFCGDGKIDQNIGEKCDNGKNNGKDGKCTLMCTIYDPDHPDCGNGEIDEGEDCQNCPVDLGKICIGGGEKDDLCGNGKIDEGENCQNCEEDVGECSARCGDGIIQEAENCENCEKDVPMCRGDFCGDGKIDQNVGEKCDNGENNGKDGKCTLMCTIYDPDHPDCGNGKIDQGEDCQSCSVDLGKICIGGGEKDDLCGNGKIDEGENCQNCAEDLGEICIDDGNPDDPCGNGKIDNGEDCQTCGKDLGEICINDGNPDNPCGNGKIDEGENCKTCEKDLGPCTILCGNGKIERGENCKNCPQDVKACIEDSCGDGKIDKNTGEECDNGANNGKDEKCTLMCTIYNPYRTDCGNGVIDEGENCKNCSVDLKDLCMDEGEKQENKPDSCGNGKIDEGENCKNCPEDLGKICDGNNPDNPDNPNTCGNGKIDEGETCENCPQDLGRCIQSTNCNSCPCEYADFAADITKGDIVRAKLWDKALSAFYKYSNSVLAESFLDLK